MPKIIIDTDCKDKCSCIVGKKVEKKAEKYIDKELCNNKIRAMIGIDRDGFGKGVGCNIADYLHLNVSGFFRPCNREIERDMGKQWIDIMNPDLALEKAIDLIAKISPVTKEYIAKAKEESHMNAMRNIMCETAEKYLNYWRDRPELLEKYGIK